MKSCIPANTGKPVVKKIIEIKLVLSPEGIIKTVKILKNETGKPNIEKCIENVMKQIKFGKLNSEKDITVNCIFEYSG